MSSHPDVVQIQIEGGYEFGECSNVHAGIRKSDEHLISAALSAYAMGKPIKVWLNESDSYFSSQKRCVITMITLS